MTTLSNERKFQHSKLVRISSRDREENSKSRYNFKANFNDYMLHNIRRVILKSVIIPNTQYNVTSHTNTLWYNAPSLTNSQAIIQIIPGQYTAIQFFDLLVSQFSLDGVTMAYTLNQNTGKATLTFNTPIILYGDISTMNTIIGLGDETITASTNISLPNIVNFSGLQKVYIGSHTLTRGITMSSSNKNHIKVFTEIPIQVPFGGTEHRTVEDITSLDESTLSTAINLSSIDLTFYDQDLNILELNGSDVQVILKVFAQ
jgi:hypothetical protein